MTLLRVVARFNTTKGGISETYWTTNSGSLHAALQYMAGGEWGGWLNRRLAILTPNWYLESLTAYDPARPRASLSTRYGPLLAPGAYPKTAEAELPFDSLSTQLQAGDTNRRNLLLAGIPDQVCAPDGSYAPTDATWAPLFSRFNAVITNGVFVIRTQTAGAILPPFTVTVSVNFKGLRLTWAGALPMGIVPGAVLRLSGENGAYFINGLWKVQAINAGAFWADLKPKRRSILGTPLSDGTARIITFSQQAITNMVPFRGSRKPLGRPSDLYHGRSKVRL